MKALWTLALLGALTTLWLLFWAGVAWRWWHREDV
jgi:hypothetical protein